MRVLLDTHAFLWWVENSPRLLKRARATIADAEDCFLSLASVWEMAIKATLGKLELAKPIRRFVTEQLAANHFRQIDITFSHIARVEALELHHSDPFDRLLVAQAYEEKLPIVSANPAFKLYPIRRIW